LVAELAYGCRREGRLPDDAVVQVHAFAEGDGSLDGEVPLLVEVQERGPETGAASGAVADGVLETDHPEVLPDVP
jgi:hypothetical protein